MTAVAVCAVAAGLAAVRTPPVGVAADPGADSSLYQLTNQDRTSNGVGPLGYNGTLQGIGEASPFSCGGMTIHGRAVDMIQRNYFSHLILGCGVYVFAMMNAYGVPYRSAGENIGWSSGFGSAGASVGWINNAFMNSPDHRANILNPGYTTMGVGSDWTPGPWTGNGGSLGNVSMFAEVFAEQGAAPPPPPPAPAPPPPAAPTPSGVRNQPAPTPALPPPAETPAPTPVPTEAPPTPLPAPPAVTDLGVAPPLEGVSSGSLSDSVRAVLEAMLL